LDTPAGVNNRTHAATPSMVSDELTFIQIEVQHSRARTASVCKSIADLHAGIAMVQEPWINKEKMLGFGAAGTTLHRVPLM